MPPQSVVGKLCGEPLFCRAVKDLPDHCTTRSAVRVRFGETDLMGIVHHAVYLSYFEAGRVEYLRRRGIEYLEWATRGVHLPVVEAHLRYRKTARFDELLLLDTRLSELGRVKVRFDYRLLRPLDGGEELVAEGFTLLACVNDAHSPTRMPADVAGALRGPESSPRQLTAV
jgi:acyl-CoA thioester hydrolase